MFQLCIYKVGAGDGEVESAPFGDEADGCCRLFSPGATVNLTAMPYSPSIFTGWSGDMESASPTAQVVMDGDKTVYVGFNLDVPLPDPPEPIGPCAMVIDPGFVQGGGIWYPRLMVSVNSDSLDRMVSGNLFEFARLYSNSHVALMNAFRRTGDRRLLDKLDSTMRKWWGLLRTHDGYLQWPHRTHGWYGTMDNIMSHFVISQFAYACLLNSAYDLAPANQGAMSNYGHGGFAGSDTTYADRAARWIAYLQNHFIAKWGGGWPGQVAHFLTHATVRRIPLLVYLERLGLGSYHQAINNDLFAWRMPNYRGDTSIRTAIGSGDALAWDHIAHVTSAHAGSHGSQPSQYGRYTASVIPDMHCEGIYIWGEVGAQMAARTMRLVFDDHPNHKTASVNVNGSEPPGGLPNPDRHGLRFDGVPGTVNAHGGGTAHRQGRVRPPVAGIIAGYVGLLAHAETATTWDGRTDYEHFANVLTAAWAAGPAQVAPPAGFVFAHGASA